jgi:hypothetical protein
VHRSTNAAGYRTIGIDSDWATFERLAAEADRSQGRASIALRQQALAMVRGVPFQGVSRGQYGWVDTEGLHSDMVNAVITCALRAGNDLLALGELEAADVALRAGLRAEPEDTYLKASRARITDARNEGLAHPGPTLQPPQPTHLGDGDGDGDGNGNGNWEELA